jgi:hypothetical protein
MDIIMEPIWDLNMKGFYVDVDGQHTRIVPYVIGMSADLEEAWSASMRPKNGTFCHLALDISCSEYLNPNVYISGQFRRRSDLKDYKCVSIYCCPA